jgi:hypothetical protein
VARKKRAVAAAASTAAATARPDGDCPFIGQIHAAALSNTALSETTPQKRRLPVYFWPCGFLRLPGRLAQAAPQPARHRMLRRPRGL